MQGGEVFVPKIPSTRVVDVAKAIAPDAEVELIGIRPGEKMHEVLVSEDESRHTVELDDMYVVEPPGALWFGHEWRAKGKPLPEGFSYSSQSNPQTLTVDEIRELVAEKS
jgi:UDP-N-acetylglucosamine 4,6-dehydratase